jgi:IS30 family transposase
LLVVTCNDLVYSFSARNHFTIANALSCNNHIYVFCYPSSKQAREEAEMETELDLRKRAIKLYYYHHLSKAKICRQLGRSRPWLDCWLKRYDPDDVEASLSNRKSGPKQASSRWSNEIRQQTIEMRRVRTQQPYALIGAEAIHYELAALKSSQVPPVRTIHYWLVQAKLVEHEPPQRENRESKPIPLPEADRLNAVQQLDLKGPVYLRGSSHKYYLVVLRDRYSRRCAIDVLTSRKAEGIVDFLVLSWQWLGLPDYLQMDNALEFRGSPRYPRSFGQVVRVAVDLNIEPVFNPPREPWRNGGVERFNGFLDKRLLSIECTDWAALRNETLACQTACNRTHRLAALDGLTPDEVAAQTSLRLLPASYQRHKLSSLSQDKGFVSFVRLVRKSGRISLGAGDRFMVDPALAYTYVLARVDLTQKIVIISQGGKRLKTYDYSADTVGAWAADDDNVVVKV